MEDWEERLRAIEPRLREWKSAYDTAFKRLRRERLPRAFFRRHTAAELQPLVEEARRAAGLGVIGELTELFDVIADRYLTVLPQERARMRARVGMEENVFELFRDYVEAGPQFVRAARDALSLRRALCALSIHDLRMDVEYVDALLGELVVAAVSFGIDWRLEFATVAKVSNPGAGGGGAHMREHLAGFEASDHFARFVRAKLKDAGRLADAGRQPKASSQAVLGG